MNWKRLLLSICMVLSVSAVFMSCSKDEPEAPQDMATVVSGDYAGKMQVMGYVDSANGYVTLTRRSATAVSCKIICEEFYLNLSEVILDLTATDNGISLTSTTKAVTGSVVNNNLYLTFTAGGGDTFVFSGSK